MTYLLDVNVLIALIDRMHIAHNAARSWFLGTGAASWASCPLTQNGVIRIIGSPRYANSAGSPAEAARILDHVLALPGHVFWPDDLDPAASDVLDRGQILMSSQVTDSYLLALAAARRGRLATLDRRLSTRAVRGGGDALCLISATA